MVAEVMNFNNNFVNFDRRLVKLGEQLWVAVPYQPYDM
jgi:hypothetical protein